jgi:EAL domain-containing protein (putative c-di-GMP-specific phosphodiesterase class I)
MTIDSLKIDRSFVSEIGNGRGGELSETIVALGHKLGLSIVAEGVETTDQAEYLRNVGCDVGQGFLFAKPMPADALRDWLEKTVSNGGEAPGQSHIKFAR